MAIMAAKMLWRKLSNHSGIFSCWRERCLRIISSVPGRKAQRWGCNTYATSSPQSKLVKHLKDRIEVTGPITVASFMKEVLTNPLSGYYMNQDMFGALGDFTTSPEISQIFGELVGVWLVHQWIQTGEEKVQLVELGPGRGTLSADILRVAKKFRKLETSLSLHLVEVSPVLREIQEKTLTGDIVQNGEEMDDKKDSLSYKNRLTKSGVPISWYSAIQDVPQGHSFFLANEFFDALPIHQFQKTEHGWREVLIDIDTKGPYHLRFVLSPTASIATETLLPQKLKCNRHEVCPQAGATVQHMADVIASFGGCALIADYGEYGSTRHTLRSFKNHKLCNVLEDPGHADVTANVDFEYLQRTAGSKVKSYGPITQQLFLQRMGIETRMEVLLKSATVSQAEQLKSGYEMLTSADQMGDKFKFFCLTPHTSPNPAAFDSL